MNHQLPPPHNDFGGYSYHPNLPHYYHGGSPNHSMMYSNGNNNNYRHMPYDYDPHHQRHSNFQPEVDDGRPVYYDMDQQYRSYSPHSGICYDPPPPSFPSSFLSSTLATTPTSPIAPMPPPPPMHFRPPPPIHMQAQAPYQQPSPPPQFHPQTPYHQHQSSPPPPQPQILHKLLTAPSQTPVPTQQSSFGYYSTPPLYYPPASTSANHGHSPPLPPPAPILSMPSLSPIPMNPEQSQSHSQPQRTYTPDAACAMWNMSPQSVSSSCTDDVDNRNSHGSLEKRSKIYDGKGEGSGVTAEIPSAPKSFSLASTPELYIDEDAQDDQNDQEGNQIEGQNCQNLEGENSSPHDRMADVKHHKKFHYKSWSSSGNPEGRGADEHQNQNEMQNGSSFGRKRRLLDPRSASTRKRTPSPVNQIQTRSRGRISTRGEKIRIKIITRESKSDDNDAPSPTETPNTERSSSGGIHQLEKIEEERQHEQEGTGQRLGSADGSSPEDSPSPQENVRSENNDAEGDPFVELFKEIEKFMEEQETGQYSQYAPVQQEPMDFEYDDVHEHGGSVDLDALVEITDF